MLNGSQGFVMPAVHLFCTYWIDLLCVWLVVNEPQGKETSNEAYQVQAIEVLNIFLCKVFS